MKPLLFLCLALTFPAALPAQGFETIFGYPSGEFPFYVVEIPAGDGYLVLSNRFGSAGVGNELQIVKIGPGGDSLWTKLPGLPFPGRLVRVAPDGFYLANAANDQFDNGFVLRIDHFNFDGELLGTAMHGDPAINAAINTMIATLGEDLSLTDYFFDSELGETRLMRLDSAGQLLWSVSTGLPALSYARYAYAQADGSVLFGGLSGNVYLLLKVDAQGQIEWQKPFPGGPLGLKTMFIRTFPDGQNYLVYGETLDHHAFLARVSATGEVEWWKSLPDWAIIIEEGVVPGENGSMYFAGTTLPDFFPGLMKVQSDGTVEWEKRYGPYTMEPQPGRSLRLRRTADQGFFMSGPLRTLSPNALPNTDPLALRLDPAGQLVWAWTGTHPDNYLDGGSLITSTGDFLVYGGSTLAGQEQQNRLIRIDSSGNVYPHLLTGRVTLDQNQNCQADPGEPGLAGWTVHATAGLSYFATTDSTGHYRFQFAADTAEIQLVLPGDLWQACPPVTTAAFQPGFDTLELDFSAQPLQACPQLALSAATPFLRRCQSNTYSIQVCNTGTVAGENILLEIALDSLFIFENASWPPQSQTGNLLTFLLADLDVNECRVLTIQGKIDCAAALGQQHCLAVTATAANACPGQPVAAALHCQPNVGPFDPNDKRGFQDGHLTDNVLYDRSFDYQIRFQNTGTDTAFQVVVVDTLGAPIDPASVRPGPASHPYTWSLEGTGILKFTFAGIALPDSNVNEPGSHGFVQFSVRLFPQFPPSLPLLNRAAIYFDQNDPVLTNTLELDVLALLPAPAPSAASPMLRLFPQPADATVWFELEDPRPARSYDLELTDALLRPLVFIPLADRTPVPVDRWPAGLYFFRLWENGRPGAGGRLVIQR